MPPRKKKITKEDAERISKQPVTSGGGGLSPADFPTLDSQGASITRPSNINYFQEYGTTGLFRLGPYIWEEWLPELQQQKGVKIYKEMATNDAIISSIFYAVEMVCRSVDWSFEPGGDSPEDEQAAEFFSQCLFEDMSVNWEDTLAEILSMFIFGWCIPTNQMILNGTGVPIKIQDVKLGDLVLTKHGRARAVTKIYTREYTGDLVELKILGYPHPIQMTPEHQLPTKDGWKTAGELNTGDIVLRPRPKLKEGGDYLSGWLVGAYVAEGSRAPDRTRVMFDVHTKEVEELANQIDEWMEREGAEKHHHLSSLKAGRYPVIGKDRPNSGRVTISHPRFRELIDSWVLGDNAHDKRLSKLPEEKEFACGLFDGWLWGDGFVSQSKGFTISAVTTVSKSLAQQMQLIAGALGLPSPIRFDGVAYKVGALPARITDWKRSELEGKARKLREDGKTLHEVAKECGVSYVTAWRWLSEKSETNGGAKQQGLQVKVYDEALGHKIVSIKRVYYEGPVYDLEVEEDHTFCAGPIIVSNCWLEQVYKKREGPHPDDPTLDSNFDDGRIGWRKWAIRTQESLLRWDFDVNGGVVAMVQLAPPHYRITEIPMEKSLLFRVKPRKGNPEGVSMLRGAYRSWYLKKNIEDIEAIGVERDLAGIPIMRVPENVLLGSDADAVSARDYYKQVITNIHRNQDEGIILPSTLYPPEDGGPGLMYDIQLLGPSSQRQFMTGDIINRYNKMIAMTVLADFLMLGQDQTGSYALAETRNDIFSLSITAILDSIAETINSYAVPRLARLNANINPQSLPKLTHGDIASSAGLDIANAISLLARGGVTIPDTVDFRNKIWNILHLPTEPEPEDAEVKPPADSLLPGQTAAPPQQTAADAMLPGQTAADTTERQQRLNVETPATSEYGSQAKSGQPSAGDVHVNAPLGGKKKKAKR